MTEDEAILYVVKGGHPGNCFDSPILDRKNPQEFYQSIPENGRILNTLLNGI